ncbi:AraC family transcriptional regulator [Compostimonas suwonensis]|uniref:AraC-like DNA-binding protein n=1 Tax=Compostimonas suwonensis TaxID=1048394 RepID=A0A2M9C4W3_9MICO|nr:AraC family transcriptional regulator [Compostimonas suwonensis]PJJ65568.1 AraC-like DNA-binding protein [Compostimonas suwonensis]
MDAISGLLAGPRAHSAFLLRSIMDPPWSIRIEDRAPLTVVAVVSGTAVIVPDEASDTGAATTLGQGDVAILRGPDSYTVADRATTPPQVIIHPGQLCTAPDGSELTTMRELGVRSWGNSPDGGTTLLTGTYQFEGEISRRLLSALPPLLVVPRGPTGSPLVPLLAEEIVRDDPGQEAVLDRLLDLVLIAGLRSWFSQPTAEAPAWFRGYSDPVVGTSLRLIHSDAAHPWTVDELARRSRVSRATFARRFTEVVGETPIAYLTEWRLALAADLLHDPQETVASVAGHVGYGSAFALSTAFKRARGVSPREHRARALHA